jgi:ATP-dependent Clp protease ATP-binding subunit ClpA
MTDRFTEQVRRILDLARAEADRLRHRYVGPEHLVLGLLRDGGNPAARILQARGVDLAAARAALRHLADRGVVPGPRPSDAELLGTLGIDLEAIRRDLEQSFGVQALEQATKEAVRARRVPRRGRSAVDRTGRGPGRAARCGVG